MIGKVVVAICMLVMGSATIIGQSVQLSSSVAENTIYRNERILFKVTLSGATFKSYGLPTFSSDVSALFSVQRVGSEFSFRTVNGQVQQSESIRFFLTPKKTGAFDIPPMILNVEGDKIETSPISMVVRTEERPQATPSQTPVINTTRQQLFPFSFPQVQPVDQPKNDVPEVMLNVTTNKTTVYVGEELIYSLDLLRRVPFLSELSGEVPDFNEFWVETLDKPANSVVQRGRFRYYLQPLLRRSLFPIRPGTIEIKPASIVYSVNVFEGRRDVTAESLSIEVLPLPDAGKPDSFSGIVGSFNIQASWKAASTVSINEPLQLDIRIYGSGNLKGISDLTFPKTDAFRIYKSSVEDAIFTTTGVNGERVFKYLLIPKQLGSHVIPSFEFSYFSPEKAKYVTLKTEPISLQINGDPSQVASTPSSVENTLKFDTYHYLKWPVSLSDSRSFWVGSIWMKTWAFVAAACFLLFSAVGVTRVCRRRPDKDRLRRDAYQIAYHTLKRTQRSGTVSSADLLAIAQQFLAHKSGRELGGLSVIDIKARLMDLNESGELDHLFNVLGQLSQLGYHPEHNIDVKPLQDELLTVLKNLKLWGVVS